MRFFLVLALASGIALSAQELIPGTARPIVDPNAPASTSGFICPMHPNEVKAEPGKCSICGMTLVPGDPMATADYRMSVVTEPRAVKAGENTKFRFTITHPLTGETVRQFADVHDRLYHLFIVSRDMTLFNHEHPVFEKDGSFTIEHTLPKAGHYVFFSDFMPVGGGPQLIATPIVTAGYEGDIASDAANLTADKSWVKSVDGVTVDLRVEPAKLVSGDELDVPIRFIDEKTEQPVTNLQRYLGAFGHAMMLSEDMMEHVHAHPEELLEGTNITEGGGPDLTFHALFPKPGHYRIWLQFLRNNKLSTVPFTVRVLRAGETAEKQ
ncbi:MAG: heavy metal-binding domain-containing protein [Acidobacteriota bacterium]|nr:heavy metal-binding domain-containing protein [Acidobacteriota bacterium]